MKFDIEHLSEDELFELNDRVVERLKLIEDVRCGSRMLEFRTGCRVTFTPEGEPPVFGVLTKFNRKTVTVVEDNGHRWNVSPMLLSHVSASDRQSVPGSKVVPLYKKHEES